jgi:hypothetical protein
MIASCVCLQEKQEDVVRGEDWAEEKRQMEEQQQAQQRKYLNEIADLKTVFHNEIKVQFHISVSLQVSSKDCRKSHPRLG